VRVDGQQAPRGAPQSSRIGGDAQADERVSELRLHDGSDLYYNPYLDDAKVLLLAEVPTAGDGSGTAVDLYWDGCVENTRYFAHGTFLGLGDSSWCHG